MKKSRFLLLANMAFLFGILLSTVFLNGSLSLNYFVLICFFAGVFMKFLKLPKLYFFTITFVFVLGFARFAWSVPVLDETKLSFYQNEENSIEVIACIQDELDLRRDHVKLTLTSLAVVVDGDFVPVEGKLLVTLPKYPEYFYGDCLKVEGLLQSPGEFNGFSYEDYLMRYGIESVMYRPFVKKLTFRRGNWFFEGLFALKFEFESRLNKLFHEPHSSFAAGLITGSRKGIPDFVMQAFNTTGLTHIIAISGYNITLLIIIISAIFGFLSRWWRFGLSVFTIVIFTLFVGSSAAVVRAAIMGVIGLVALQFGRKAIVILVLFMSAVIMNLMNPYILIFDVGFQLSFAATLGLIVFADKFTKYFRWLPDFFAIRESLTMTLAAQVFTLPLIIYHFGRFSLISPIANVLTGPLIPLAMLFSFFSVLLSYVWGGFGLIFSFLAWVPLEAIIKIAQILAGLPYANLEF